MHRRGQTAEPGDRQQVVAAETCEGRQSLVAAHLPYQPTSPAGAPVPDANA
jgi:hypothetical protein